MLRELWSSRRLIRITWFRGTFRRCFPLSSVNWVLYERLQSLFSIHSPLSMAHLAFKHQTPLNATLTVRRNSLNALPASFDLTWQASKRWASSLGIWGVSVGAGALLVWSVIFQRASNFLHLFFLAPVRDTTRPSWGPCESSGCQLSLFLLPFDAFSHLIQLGNYYEDKTPAQDKPF